MYNILELKTISELKEETENLYSPKVESETKLTDFSIGSFVTIKNTTTSGRIVHIDNEKKKALVESGSIKMQVELKELVLDNLIKKEKTEPHYHNFKIPETKYRLDIRGRKPEEADFEIVKFIDDSYVTGQDRIE